LLHAPGRLGSRTRTLHDNRNPLARPRPSDLRPFAAHFKGGEFWSHLVCSSGTHTLVTAAHSMHLRHTHTHTLVTAGHCMHLRHTHWSLQHTVRTSDTQTGHCGTLYAPQGTHYGHCSTLYAPHTHTHTPVNAAHCTTCYNAQQCIYVPGITFATNSNNYP